MGRTYRRRRSKSKTSVSLDENPEIIELTRWIKRSGFQIERKIKIAQFCNTGRGVMALERVKRGDLIMTVPSRMIISLITLETDLEFVEMFNQAVRVRFTCQELISFYVSYLKMIDSVDWRNYLNSLPATLTMPYFINRNCIECSDRLFSIVENQRNRIYESYDKFRSLLSNRLKKSFDLDLYEWSYFIVNSRCVYLDPGVVISLYNSLENRRLIEFVSDEPKLGLVPFLDMFNHSHDAETSSEFTIESNKASFKLTSLSGCDKFAELFISYGQHCNLKLIAEYGFSLPVNPLTRVEFDFEDVCAVFKQSISSERFRYIRKHNLNRDLYVDSDNYSYNLLRLLFVIVCDDKSAWNAKIYSDLCEIDAGLHSAGNRVLKHKLDRLNVNLAKFVNGDSNLVVGLLGEFVSILSRWINKHDIRE